MESKIESLDGSNYPADIQNYFEYIIKKPGGLTNNPPVQLSINKKEKIIVFKIRSGYFD